MDDNPVVKFESIPLQKQALALKTEISNQLLEHFGEPAKVAVNLLANFVRDVVTVEVLQHVWGEDVGTLEIETPRNWWEMLKRDHAPAWFLRRFPVKVAVQVYHASVLYPQVSFPDWKHSTILVHKYDRSGYMTTEAQDEQRNTSGA